MGVTIRTKNVLYVPQRRPPSGRAGRPAASHWSIFGVRSSAAWQPLALRRWGRRASASCPCREGGPPGRRRRDRVRRTSTRRAAWHPADTPSPPAADSAVGWGRTAASECGALVGRPGARRGRGILRRLWGRGRRGGRKNCGGH